MTRHWEGYTFTYRATPLKVDGSGWDRDGEVVLTASDYEQAWARARECLEGRKFTLTLSAVIPPSGVRVRCTVPSPELPLILAPPDSAAPEPDTPVCVSPALMSCSSCGRPVWLEPRRRVLRHHKAPGLKHRPVHPDYPHKEKTDAPVQTDPPDPAPPLAATGS